MESALFGILVAVLLVGAVAIGILRHDRRVAGVRPPLRSAQAFWVYLSGQDARLAYENDEVNLYVRYGALTFVSAMLGFWVGFLFLFYGLPPTTSPILHVFACLAAGAVVGRGVLSIDQFIVTSVHERDGIGHRLLNASARTLVSVVIALVGAYALMVPLAHGLIDQYLEAHRQVIPSPALVLKQKTDNALLSEVNSAIAADQRSVAGDSLRASAEEHGKGPSQIAGCGKVCQPEAAALATATQQLKTDLLRRASLQQQVRADGLAISKNEAAQLAKPIDADIFERHQALAAIEAKEPAVQTLDWLLKALILVLDLSPVLMKSFSSRSATDQVVLTRRLAKRADAEFESDVLVQAQEAARDAVVASMAESERSIGVLRADRRLADARDRLIPDRPDPSWPRREETSPGDRR